MGDMIYPLLENFATIARVDHPIIKARDMTIEKSKEIPAAVLVEGALTFGEAAKRFSQDYKITPGKLRRWATRGVLCYVNNLSTARRRMFLESVVVGGRRLTSINAIKRFLVKCNGDN